MKLLDPRAVHVLKNPVAFALQVLKAFCANQGLLPAGAVACYALLSILPLLIFLMPVGRLSVRHALIGGASASLLWEIIRHALSGCQANKTAQGWKNAS